MAPYLMDGNSLRLCVTIKFLFAPPKQTGFHGEGFIECGAQLSVI
jgi:hypothetical protein